jgi:hypothetical protein
LNLATTRFSEGTLSVKSNFNTAISFEPGTIADAAPVSLTYMTGGDRTRVQSVTTAGISTETNAYDIEGRVSQYTMTLNARPGNPLVMSYLYDSVSRLTEVLYPAQYGVPGSPRKKIEPQYDNASRLTQMKVAEQVHLSGIVYNPMSQVTELITGAYTGNADIEQYTYDTQTGLLTNQKVIKQNSNVKLLDLDYNYNRGNSKGSLNGKTGQLTNIVNKMDGNKDRVYEFDTLGRLTTAKGGIAAGGCRPRIRNSQLDTELHIRPIRKQNECDRNRSHGKQPAGTARRTRCDELPGSVKPHHECRLRV